MRLVARGTDLIGLSQAQLPEITTMFLKAVALPEAARRPLFGALYPLLRVADFPRDVLAEARGLLAYTWPSSMGWSDLGTPERLREWLCATTSPHGMPATGQGTLQNVSVGRALARSAAM